MALRKSRVWPLSVATRDSLQGCPASPRPTTSDGHLPMPLAKYMTGHLWAEDLVTSSPCRFPSCSAGCGRSPAPPSLALKAHHCSISWPWAGMTLPGALASPPLGDEMSEKRAGAPGLRGLNRRTVGCIITHQPPEMERVWLTKGRVGGGGTQESKARSGTAMSAVPQGLEAPAGRVLGKWAGGGSRGAREADVTNFSSAPGWPEAAWDFPVWKDRLGNQATWGPLPHPSWVLSAGKAVEVLGTQSRLGVPSRAPPSLPEPPEQIPLIPPVSQPQPQIMATKECLGLYVPTNEGLRV